MSTPQPSLLLSYCYCGRGILKTCWSSGLASCRIAGGAMHSGSSKFPSMGLRVAGPSPFWAVACLSWLESPDSTGNPPHPSDKSSCQSAWRSAQCIVVDWLYTTQKVVKLSRRVVLLRGPHVTVPTGNGCPAAVAMICAAYPPLVLAALEHRD